MFDSKLKKLGKNVVLGFFAAITSLLTLLCLFNNAYLSWDEHTTIVADKPFYLLLWFVIVLFFVYFVRKHYRTQDTYYFNKIFIILSLILLIVGIFMIFKFDFVPVADQASILEAAAGLKNGNYSYFTPMGYVGKCSNQAGIVVILYYLSFIFGENNYQAFQVLNIIGLLVSYYCLCKISQISFHNDELKNWTLILLFIFLRSPHPWCSAILMTLCTAGLFAVSSPEQVLMIRVAPGGEMLGGACVQMAFNLGNAIGAYIGGLALSGGYRYPALAGVPFALMGFILFLVFYKKFQAKY